MHHVTPYFLKSFRGIENKDYRYHVLNRIGSSDLLDVIYDALDSLQSDKYTENTDNKQVYKVSELKKCETNRTVFAWFHMGRYGNRSEIIDLLTSNTTYNKSTNNADVYRFFIAFKLPIDEEYGYSVIHGIRTMGVKTLVYQSIYELLKARTNFSLNMDVASHADVAEEWKNSVTKELVLKRFVVSDDIADQLKSFPTSDDFELDLVVRSKRGRNINSNMEDWANSESEYGKFLEYSKINNLCSETKMVVELGGKRRTFSLNKDLGEQMSKVDVQEEDVVMEDGNPTYESMTVFCCDLIEDLYRSTTGG